MRRLTLALMIAFCAASGVSAQPFPPPPPPPGPPGFGSPPPPPPPRLMRLRCVAFPPGPPGPPPIVCRAPPAPPGAPCACRGPLGPIPGVVR
ncbi:hypothetical protein EI171_30985 [Bradyrhizobium sp. LCT2]|nr:hypothetical protein EI171_30985 [Bradyrhizobium sp. LCT2]